MGALLVATDPTTPLVWRPSLVLLSLVVLVLVNGVFVAAEVALLAVRRGRMEDLAAGGDGRARRLIEAVEDLPRTLTGGQFAITLCSLGLGVLWWPSLVLPVRDGLTGLGLTPGSALALGALAVFLGVVGFHLLVGELLPKHLALAHAEPVALALARPAAAARLLLRPIAMVGNHLAGRVLRALRLDPVAADQLVHSPDELALALAESQRQGTISPQDARVMGAALRLSSLTASAAMTPRVDLAAVPDTATIHEVRLAAQRSGHTRIPVFHDDLDHVVGLVHVKDAILAPDDARPLAEVLRPITTITEDRDLERLLREMLDAGLHAVLVVDEFGGTAGLLTLEDVLEELVGDIDDEFDPGELARRGTGQAWIVPGTLRRDELERQVGLQLVSTDTETVSGWLVEQLGRLPETDDQVTTGDGWRVTVQRLEGRRAGEIEIRPPVRRAAGRVDPGRRRRRS